uniref:PDZ domain-containing protein n=1 Tax=Ditylenchus dipsaci TaxID=166011 RepID=A0A915D2Z8_9BILA
MYPVSFVSSVQAFDGVNHVLVNLLSRFKQTELPNGKPAVVSKCTSPRLCVVKKSVDNQEYGFNLHAERGKGQFVGVVDDGSPAQKAGLKSGDRIFAVNGESIVGASHKEVVLKIKSNPMQCELLVISEEGAQWYQEHGIPINSQMPNIIRTCEEPIYSDATAYYSTSSAPWEMQTSPVVVSKMRAQLRFPSKERDRQQVFSSQVGPSANNSQKKYVERAFYAGVQSKMSTSARTSPKNDNGVQSSVKSPSVKAMPPRPRLCTLVKQGPVHEFGFNLHAERGKGHFIGNVDKDGIADRAGLETGQRIVGVNGQLIYPNTAHKEVVALIKRDPLVTELLVAAEEIDRWYTETGTPYSYERVTVFETDNRSKAPSSAASNTAHHPGGMAISTGYGNYDPRPAAKTNGSSGVQSRRETVVSNPDRLQTTYMTRVDDVHHLPMRTQNAAIVVSDDHKTSIHVDTTQEESDDGVHSQHSNEIYQGCVQPSGSPDDLLEKVFSRVKPPAVRTDLNGHNEDYENRQSNDLVNQEVRSTKELLVARNGHHHQLTEQTNKHPVPLIVSSYSNEKKSTTGLPAVGLRDFPSPVSTDSHTSTGSMVKDENKDIFKLSAKEARQLMKQKKKDPRMQNMSLEEKYKVIANL